MLPYGGMSLGRMENVGGGTTRFAIWLEESSVYGGSWKYGGRGRYVSVVLVY